MKFELNIYGADDEILRTYGTNRCPWGLFIKAAEMQDKMKEMTITDQINAVGDIVKSLFVDLTDEDLAKADINDIMSVFTQLTNMGNKIERKNK